MKCPNCDHPESSVKDSREQSKGSVIRRRRRCPQCEHRWTTHEVSVPSSAELVDMVHDEAERTARRSPGLFFYTNTRGQLRHMNNEGLARRLAPLIADAIMGQLALQEEDADG